MVQAAGTVEKPTTIGNKRERADKDLLTKALFKLFESQVRQHPSKTWKVLSCHSRPVHQPLFSRQGESPKAEFCWTFSHTYGSSCWIHVPISGASNSGLQGLRHAGLVW